jgi:hypothetical protein
MRTAGIAMIAVATLGLSAAGGFTAAASTRSPRTVRACANSKGTLKLLSKKGHCAKGYSRVTLNKKGPKGAPGLRGLRGPTGPGAQSSGATGTLASGFVAGPSISVAGTDLTVLTQCQAATAAIVNIDGSTNYAVRGAAQATFAGNTAVTEANFPIDAGDSQTVPIPNSGSLIDFSSNSGSADRSSALVAESGSSGKPKLGTTVLVTDGTATFTIDVFLSVDATSCSVAAQVTPSS